MTISKNAFKKVALAAARAGDSKKAGPIRVYDLAGKSTLADYAVLMTVESAPQLDAVEEEVQVCLKRESTYCLHKDGMRSKNWKVLDYGGVLVHIFDQKAAEFYAMEKVYAGYKAVEWEAPSLRAPAAGKPAGPAPVRAAVKKAAPVKKPRAKKAGTPKKGKPAVKAAAVKKTVRAGKGLPGKRSGARKK